MIIHNARELLESRKDDDDLIVLTLCADEKYHLRDSYVQVEIGMKLGICI